MASCTSSSSKGSVIDTTLPLLSQHIFYRDSVISVGLDRYPTAPGHMIAMCDETDLLSLAAPSFLRVISTLRGLSTIVSSGLQVQRCALCCDGGKLVSMIPLRGLSKTWQSVVHAEEEYHEEFPGYLTSKNGPKILDESLNETQSRIIHITGIKKPYNNHFDGDMSDQNIFARIIRGELPQWRIWEDDFHIAFLTPFGNTPGYTVLVPRKHLGSDIFSLNDDDFAAIVTSAHTIAQHLKRAFNVERCGMFFEGFEIDYAHIKLIPVHQQRSDGKSFTPVLGPAPFQEKYDGYLTTQLGPLASDLDAMSKDANKLRTMLAKQTQTVAPKTWQQADTHSLQALQSPWYSAVFTLQDTLFQVTNDIFHKQLGYKYALMPVTTDSISSPMGLGSDSLPVHVNLHGQDTYLADSMQFTLEYALRLEEGLKGAYYVGCSFRGEDHDHMLLNQFFHTECELTGTIDRGIETVERYVIAAASTLLKHDAETISSVAGSTSHITDLLSLYKSDSGRFPRISTEAALKLSEITSNPDTWEYIVPDDHSKGRALKRLGERMLIKKFAGAVWLTEMDHMGVPFYQAFMPNTKNSKALCADLLLGPGEVLGLGQRHADAGDVRTALLMHQVPEHSYDWYMAIRDDKVGGRELQTTGWGLGMERFLAWILQHDDMAIVPRLKSIKFSP